MFSLVYSFFIFKFFGHSICRILIISKALVVPSSYMCRLNEYWGVKQNVNSCVRIHSNLHTGTRRYEGTTRKDWIPAFAGMTKFHGNEKTVGFML